VARPRVAAACGLAAAAFAFSTASLAALAQPAYDQCSQFISELGQTGAPHAGLVNLAGFLPTGLLTLGFSLRSAGLVAHEPRARWGFVLFSAVGWAYLAAAFFPCDPGCPSAGSATQQIHNAFGAAEYLAGGAGLALLARSRPGFLVAPGFQQATMVGAVMILLAFAGMLAPQLAAVRGLLQRGAEVVLLLWMAWCSLQLWRVGPQGVGVSPGPASR